MWASYCNDISLDCSEIDKEKLIKSNILNLNQLFLHSTDSHERRVYALQIKFWEKQLRKGGASQ